MGFGQLHIFIRILGNPQVGQLDFSPPGQHDVIRFDIPVHDLLFGGCLQGFRHRFGNDQRIHFTQTRRLFEHIPNGTTVDIFHHNITEIPVLVVADIQHVHDIRMIDRTGDFRFLNESPDEFTARDIQPAGKDFDRAEYPQGLMPRQIDAPHPALSEFFDNDAAVDPVPRLQIPVTA